MFAARALAALLVQPTPSLGETPRRSFRAPCQNPIHRPSGTASAPRSGARSASPPGTSGSTRSACIELRGTTLVVEVPEDKRTWVADPFRPAALGLRGDGARRRRARRRSPTRAEVADTPRPETRRAAAAQELNPRLTFDQFVIGDCNRLAHAAALSVAELPGLAYNPLFICGPPGLGKTHLLHSIANYVAEHGGGLTVRYTTVEAFTDHFVGAIQGGGLEAFKAAYRGVDVLLVDDVQFLQAKAKTEQEFFHTFNALHQAGSQLVLTSDRPPRDLAKLEDRLRERFEAGLVCDVRPPERATRLTILRKRVAQDDVGEVDPAALEAIADRVDANIRALEGALIRVVAFGSLTGRPVTAALADEVLAGLYPELQAPARAPCARSRSRPARPSGSRWTTCSRAVAPSRSPSRARSPCTSRAS